MKYKLGIIIGLACCLFTGCSTEGTGHSVLHSESQTTTDMDSIESLAQANLESFRASISAQAQPLSKTDWEKLRWVSKALVFLRGGEGLQKEDDLDWYLKTSKENIVDALLEAPRFPESVLMYNAFFLGGRVSKPRTDGGTFDSRLQQFPTALLSGREVALGGDYFKLFDITSGVLAQPIGEPSIFFPAMLNLFSPEVDPPPALTDRQQREVHYTEVQNTLQRIIEDSEDGPRYVNFKKFCLDNSFLNFTLSSVGIKLPLEFAVVQTRGNLQICDYQFAGIPYPQMTRAYFLESLKGLQVHLKKLIEYARSLEGYDPGVDLKKFRIVNPQDFAPDYSGFVLSGGAAQAVTNSSTNMNRKRAAYVLDRFLCDNLVPIDVEVPATHTGGAHGSEPSCYACHYRLDPMAGYFKDRGHNLSNFGNYKDLIFDDAAVTDRETYATTWKNPPSTDRKWNIGIIRSEKDPSLNHYGEDLEDLFSSLKEMPQVKRCLTRRLFEFATSPHQNVDREYLDEISDEFIALSSKNSVTAIKYLFRTFALSKTFLQRDPESTQCYDFPVNFDPAGSPPCEVRYLLDNKCASCHFAGGGEAELDLTSWEKLEGDRYGFVHEPEGHQLGLDESFTRIQNALKSTDPEKRMPLKKHMDPVDRETLFLWINQQIQGAQ